MHVSQHAILLQNIVMNEIQKCFVANFHNYNLKTSHYPLYKWCWTNEYRRKKKKPFYWIRFQKRRKLLKKSEKNVIEIVKTCKRHRMNIKNSKCNLNSWSMCQIHTAAFVTYNQTIAREKKLNNNNEIQSNCQFFSLIFLVVASVILLRLIMLIFIMKSLL